MGACRMKWLILILLSSVSYGNIILTGNESVSYAGNDNPIYIKCYDNSRVFLGSLNNPYSVLSLYATNNSLITLDVADYILSNTGGRYSTGFVTGHWQNGVPFNIQLGLDISPVPVYGTETHLVFIPEMNSCLLFCGSIFIFNACGRKLEMFRTQQGFAGGCLCSYENQPQFFRSKHFKGKYNEKKVCPNCKDKGVTGMPDFIGSNEICTMTYCNCKIGKALLKKDTEATREYRKKVKNRR